MSSGILQAFGLSDQGSGVWGLVREGYRASLNPKPENPKP